jgi:phosphatidylserine/phosphatidylglycerophosphate/cardiolipin synthase-like enzyme
MGSISTVPHNYDRKLQKMGIKAFAFNRFLPFLNARINNRDHRKMLVIDGSTALPEALISPMSILISNRGSVIGKIMSC